MQNPVDMLLASVQWEAIAPTQIVSGGDLPHCTHQAVLEIGGKRLAVYQLSDGQRVVDSADFEAFFNLAQCTECQAIVPIDSMNCGGQCPACNVCEGCTQKRDCTKSELSRRICAARLSEGLGATRC